MPPSGGRPRARRRDIPSVDRRRTPSRRAMAPAVSRLGRAFPGQPAQSMRRGEGRRGEMTALDWVLVVAIVVLAAFMVTGLVLGTRALRQLQSTKEEDRTRRD